jgi:hypothetical protein
MHVSAKYKRPTNHELESQLSEQAEVNQGESLLPYRSSVEDQGKKIKNDVNIVLKSTSLFDTAW